ncbi:class C beta-lactamase-related serine hydrolase [Flavobacterium silvisoli]|uniref:Class C beta-lactamase-related serine hydrolase n=1 Tax=Flavobacterium silvisoli TaxID=2529433 RepID=A0A4Q9Z4R6_9FLAO|nr:serine hydrolase [Flavobacterium silvisoli]TBX71170.1 class C beta-lactamase-related serine hydrolase [Flavobacterium silvisoli]
MKKFLKIFVVVVLILLVYLRIEIYPKLDLISGFSAKSVASAHFIDGRSLETIQQNDNDIDKVDWATNKIDEKNRAVVSSVHGIKQRKAIFRKGLGATLIDDDFDISKPYEVPNRTAAKSNLPFPYGDEEPKDTILANIDYTRLHSAIDAVFDPKGTKDKRTRSVIVIYKDRIIAEKYADGFNKNSLILGWSMTKSLTATYFGILQKQGKIDIMKPAPVPEWQKDSRRNITINDLLHMNSGLEWEEDYTKISDVTKMLFQAKDMTECQAQKKAVFKPNTHWNYSSGTTNLLSGILRKQFKTHQEYLDFWYSSLLDKIGMHSALIETDMKGNFVGSSYGWATTRDWAKFGLLYLHQGNWNGEQLFDKSWAKYVATPTRGSDGKYGAHFWLNAGGKYPDVPRDLYHCSGYQGQMVFIIPSEDLVVVRMGLNENLNYNLFLSEIIESLKKNSDD